MCKQYWRTSPLKLVELHLTTCIVNNSYDIQYQTSQLANMVYLALKDFVLFEQMINIFK